MRRLAVPAAGAVVVLGALAAVSGSLLRAKVTDAGRSQRLIPVLGSGQTAGREYLEFEPGGFAAHPGRLSMRAPSGGDLVVLAPPSVSGQRLRRTVERGSASHIARDGAGQLSGHLGESPADFGYPYQEVSVEGLPAWVVPPPVPAKSSGLWVIHVHGLGSSRSQCLRGVEAFAGLGFTSLLPSYRTSLDLSPDPGPSHLGVSEWEDIDAARRYALDHGAKRILFVGWSLGASIVLRTIARAGDNSTAGVVLVSPALDWPANISAQLRGIGCPRIIARLLPHTLNLVRAKGEPVIRWKEMPGTYMQKHLTLPTMIFHGSDDHSVPVELSRILVSRQKQPVRFVEFEGAHHTLEWNSAPELWNQSVQAWCRSLGLDVSEDFIDHPVGGEINHGR
jgi:pimeloyl-ACP methyl ester carboxylesterase